MKLFQVIIHQLKISRNLIQRLHFFFSHPLNLIFYNSPGLRNENISKNLDRYALNSR